ncbi:anti-sigma factor family protein [Streptomyces hypolithicus]
MRLHRAWAECREHITHMRLRGSVDAYADGELSAADRARVATHIARCWACNGYVQTLRLVKHSLRNGPKRAPISLAAARMRRFAGQLTAAPTAGQNLEP